jgi:hypothetical protein
MNPSFRFMDVLYWHNAVLLKAASTKDQAYGPSAQKPYRGLAMRAVRAQL